VPTHKKTYYEQTKVERESCSFGNRKASAVLQVRLKLILSTCPTIIFRASDLHEIIEHLKTVPVVSGECFQRRRFFAGSGNPMEGPFRNRVTVWSSSVLGNVNGYWQKLLLISVVLEYFER